MDADPARTPTLAMFAQPDYFLPAGALLHADCARGGCVTQNTGFAWDHGDYAAEINTNYAGVRRAWGAQPRPGRACRRARARSSAGADSGQTVVTDYHFRGPWVDETDIRPTIMYLTGLRDDYEHDGRVITQILDQPEPRAQPAGRDRPGRVLQAAQLQRR